MIAGRDTVGGGVYVVHLCADTFMFFLQTAATLTFVVYLLCMYPDVFKRLRAEILDKIGPTQMPTFDNVRNMKYLRAVINGEPSHSRPKVV